jgi:hypothetical protein
MNEPTRNPDKPMMTNAGMVSLAFEMGFVIAVPAVVMSIVGKRLDAMWGMSPWLTLSGIGFALMLSTAWIYMRLKDYAKR